MGKTGRPPDFILKSLNRVNGRRSAKVGALWVNYDAQGRVENMNLKMNPGQRVLATENMTYTFFPNVPYDPTTDSRKAALEGQDPRPQPEGEDACSEI